MIRRIDRLLDRTTMYRLLLFYLVSLLGLGLILAAAGAIRISPVALLSTVLLYLAVTLAANWGFARLFRVDAHAESTIITALILSLISGPVLVFSDPRHAGYLALAGLFAVASKYLIAIRRHHLFNPAAFGILLTGLLFGEYSTWWVGNIALLPLVVAGGLLLLRKINRFRMVGLFVASAVLFLFAQGILEGIGAATALSTISFTLLRSELPFAALVMLTEPLTSPKAFSRQVPYAVLTAFCFLPRLNLFGYAISPEEALLIGNLFSLLVSPSYRMALHLRERQEIAPSIFAFTFERPRGFRHRAGQYLEWRLALPRSDARGNRRFFTIASSPTEKELMIVLRIPAAASAYKRALHAMRPGDRLLAGELAGDFVLPHDPAIPLVFIAGGIGITPFRSIFKELLDTGERRSIVLFFLHLRGESLFEELLAEAEQKLGLSVVHILTDAQGTSKGSYGRIGQLNRQAIEEKVSDYRKRRFYLAGSLEMVEATRSLLRGMGVAARRITADAFPGYPR